MKRAKASKRIRRIIQESKIRSDEVKDGSKSGGESAAGTNRVVNRTKGE